MGKAENGLALLYALQRLVVSEKLTNQRTARELSGKTVDRIECDGSAVIIRFTDGTAVEMSGDRPQYGRLFVYIYSTRDYI